MIYRRPARFASSPAIDWAALRALPIVEVAAALGIAAQGSKSIRCPFDGHPDRNPSFSFDTKTNTCRCYGCGRGGSTIDLVVEMRGLSVSEAAKWLSSRCGAQRQPSFKGQRQRRPNLERAPRQADPEVYAWLIEQCTLTPAGAAYLQGREITERTRQRFGVAEVRDARELLRQLTQRWTYERVSACGLISDRGRLIFPDQSLVFPFMVGSDCRYLQARYLGARENIPKWIGLNGVQKLLYNASCAAEAKDIYICEGVMDVLSAYELGFAAIGLLGGHSRIPQANMVELRGKSVYIVPDNDRTGREMAHRLSSRFLELGVDHVVQSLSVGNDLNEYLVLSRRNGQ